MNQPQRTEVDRLISEIQMYKLLNNNVDIVKKIYDSVERIIKLGEEGAV